MKAINLLILIVLLGSCASMMEDYCSENTAYSAGVNDARNGQDMNAHYAYSCPADMKEQATESYNKGYHTGLEAGEKGSGQINVVLGGGGPKRECLEKYGKRVCGYNCVEAYGNIRCASRPDHNCVEAYGDIRCGRDCRTEYGQIVCD